MASIYSCKECGSNFNLHTSYLYPPDFYFEAGNKGTSSFSAVDSSKFKFEKEDKIRPFFETLDYWGIQRKRTKMMCMNCGKLVGYVYDDGPPMTDSPGQFHFGPSQVIPRAARYRIKNKALKQRVADGKKSKKIAPPPPPPASRFLSTKLTTPSLTKQEIAKYWKQKRKTEEEHFLDAIKAAARIKARNLSAEEYNHFLYSLKVDDDNMENEMVPKNISEINENMKEKRVGIKDWWTKSKYAYLNQPDLKSMERHGSTYIPQLYCYKAPPPPVTSTFGIF